MRTEPELREVLGWLVTSKKKKVIKKLSGIETQAEDWIDILEWVLEDEEDEKNEMSKT